MSFFLPHSFLSAGVHCGLKKSGKLDLGLIVSEIPATLAAIFTTNSIKAHCILDNQARLSKKEKMQAILVNSGNANACTGELGLASLQEIKNSCAAQLGISKNQILTASTGIIGIPLPAPTVTQALPGLSAKLQSGILDFAEAILTTDTSLKIKEVPCGKHSKILGIGKGSGMIHPQMATMLGFILTDLKIEQNDLQKALEEANQKSFNQISVDGDTSTNDMVLLLANGATGEEISLQEFQAKLNQICLDLAKQIAADGEGATKLIEVKVKNHPQASQIAKGIVQSSLVKTAIFGADPNWGRILAAAGQAANLDFYKCSLQINGYSLLKKGQVQNLETTVLSSFIQKNREILIELDAGEQFTPPESAWGCDLSYDYIKINAEYTS